jgi:hypothetical protein
VSSESSFSKGLRAEAVKLVALRASQEQVAEALTVSGKPEPVFLSGARVLGLGIEQLAEFPLTARCPRTQADLPRVVVERRWPSPPTTTRLSGR